eukprot:CAMPEP_0197848848 /NCGR_PEP_ID=MMETSP1438-20131217/10215_1 /TAXON_ID=1461541 /ORGANISM="Pterosperma sp., Strain CCMP1384" /LENGTH=945 /DNA_ID=CAMNT_0043461277 /DNA_START=270 /DNA_END=3107 /DNA_ORIENTATION=-
MAAKHQTKAACAEAVATIETNAQNTAKSMPKEDFHGAGSVLREFQPRDIQLRHSDTINKDALGFQHLHFGAGRLGMGLVIPAIYDANISFAVVQRPKQEWEDLGKFPLNVDVRVNDVVVAHNVTILSMQQKDIDSIISKATSFSCSVGTGMMDAVAPLLTKLPTKIEDSKKPVLYCCENDHNAVKRLKEELADRVYVVDCMVDRVCTRRIVASEESSEDESDGQQQLDEHDKDEGACRTASTNVGESKVSLTTKVETTNFVDGGMANTIRHNNLLGDYLTQQVLDYLSDETHIAGQKPNLQANDQAFRDAPSSSEQTISATKPLPRHASEDSLTSEGLPEYIHSFAGSDSDADAEFDRDDTNTVDGSNENNIDGVVHVQAEPWRGSIIILDPTVHSNDRVTPFSENIAIVPRSDMEAEYLAERKTKLVNGMHTVLAFTSLLSRWKRGKTISASEEYVLVKYARLSRQDQRMLEAQRTVRVAQLLQRFGVAQIMCWHGCDTQEDAWEHLLHYSDEILLERFGRVEDLVSRVLGGGVGNRWLTRLRPAAVWMDAWIETDDQEGHDLAAFFRYAAARDRYATAEASSAYPAAVLKAHVKECRRFCNQEYEITHKGKPGGTYLSSKGLPKVSSLRDLAAGDDLRDNTAHTQNHPVSYMSAVQKTTLSDRYHTIASHRPDQDLAYTAWLRSGAVNTAALVANAGHLGLDLDVASGQLSYSGGFRAPELCFELVYVRHGKTEGNTEPRVFQGNVDEMMNALNKVGLEQAAEAGVQLDQLGVQPDLIVMSPLGRAKDTAEAFLQSNPHLREVAEVWWESHEMAFGGWDNVMVKDMEDANICHLFYLQQNAIVKSDDAYISPDGQELRGENFVEVLVRMRRVLVKMEQLMQAARKDMNRAPRGLMFGHSMAGAALQILTGQGKTEVDENGKEYLCFDGKHIMPHATPTFLHRA